ncbi:hypothetical protein NDK47_12975 [Brevibacillus ruminantium]|uniref:Uncharacterized protein n=1 Tax=Brevibacillus ruminantium TaxID=2950604 RepID=A0ABY4WML6_9BACL|nr:hypothetical protein [Brevibacillus ruminantium]USG68413.1 hypothetical protein NDK47_12975 [Brevibacillus ruminantium]
MHYYGNETIMSLEQVLRLRPNEVRILEWVRTYEYLENQYGLDDAVPYFLDIRCEADTVRIRRNKITDFPNYHCEEERVFPDVEQALPVFREWAEKILGQLDGGS